MAFIKVNVETFFKVNVEKKNYRNVREPKKLETVKKYIKFWHHHKQTDPLK